METVIQFEPRPGNPKEGWWRMVTIEANGGAHHMLTSWSGSTRKYAQQVAKREGVRFVEVEA